MSIASVTPPSNPPKDLPLFCVAHIAVHGKCGVGGDFAAQTEMGIYRDRATVVTKIMKYSALSAAAQKQLDPVFSKSLGSDKKTMVLSTFGPTFDRENLSDQDRQEFEKEYSDGSSYYPFVKQVTQTNTWKTGAKRKQIAELVQTVTMVVNQCFPNRQKAKSESEEKARN